MPTVHSVAACARAAVRDVGVWHRGEPTSATTYRAIRRLHDATGGASSRAALAVLRSVPSIDRIPVPPEPSPVRALRTEGVAMVDDVLDGPAVDRVVAFASTAPAAVRVRGGALKAGTYRDRPPGTLSAMVVGQFVAEQPDIQHVMATPWLWELAAAYFRARPVVQPPQLYWTCVDDGFQESTTSAKVLARNLHADFDGLRGLRIHVYLTDVDKGSGPMVYVPGSHRYARRRSVLRSDDPTPGVPIVGSAGTTFVSDSHGLHRGTRPTRRDRLFLVLPVQATGFGGYYHRRMALRPRDSVFEAAIARGAPELRLFTKAATRPPR